MLVTSLPNIRYLTGFSGSNALVLVTPTEVYLLTDFRYKTQVREEVGELAYIRVEPMSVWAGLWEVLGGLTPQMVIGFESAALVHQDFQRLLADGARWQWR